MEGHDVYMKLDLAWIYTTYCPSFYDRQMRGEQCS